MKKFIFPTLIVIFSSLVFSACKKPFDQAVTTENKEEVALGKKEENKGGFSGTIKDLMSAGKAQKCVWTIPEQGSSTVYVDGEKTRIEINMPAIEDRPVQQMITISDPTWAYTWNPATKKGMKMNVEEMNEEAKEAEEQMLADGDDDDDYQAMVNQDYEFKCESWKANASMFTPPTDVEFTDMNAVMDQVKQNTQEMKKVCDMLTGEQKEECLKGFEE